VGKAVKARSSEVQPSRKDSRGSLIDAALDIILKEGVDNLRIEDVCERVGVTKGSLYWHFTDRDGLIREALLEQLRRISDEQLATMNDAITSATDSDDYLSRIVGALANPFDKTEVEQRWKRLELIVATRNDPALSKVMSEVQRRQQKFMADAMERAAENGLLRRDVDPQAVAAVLSTVALGSVNLSLLESDGPSPEAWTSLMVLFISLLFPAV
jgi:AcrR family transcriptional regulator